MVEPGVVELQGQGNATVVVFPEHYFEHEQLEPKTSGADTSIDQVGATKLKKLAGFTEDDARNGGWATDAELDHPPG